MRVATMKKTSVLLISLFLPAVLSAQNSDVILQGFIGIPTPATSPQTRAFGGIR